MKDSDPAAIWRELARHDVAMATVRRFAEQAGALRVLAVIDGGEGRPAALVDCDPAGALTISAAEQTFLVPDEALADVRPLPVEAPRPVPATALHVDVATGEIAAPIGAVQRMAEGVRDLARALGGRSVASADFATRSGEALTIAAREGEDVVLAVGEEQFGLG